MNKKVLLIGAIAVVAIITGVSVFGNRGDNEKAAADAQPVSAEQSAPSSQQNYGGHGHAH